MDADRKGQVEPYRPLYTVPDTEPAQATINQLTSRRKTAFAAFVASVLLVLQYAIYVKLEPKYTEVMIFPELSSYKRDFDWYALEPKSDIEWVPCYDGHKCARLLLPLDHGTPDGPTTAIALRMIPATDTENYRGTLFVNPGGPGGAGTIFLERSGRYIPEIVGPSFDVLGFDPRGVGMSTPSASCFDSDAQRDIWNTQEGHQLLNASDSSLGVFRARAQVFARRCEDRLGGEWGIGRFASSAHVARDIVEIAQKLGQDRVQYWGFSYGSILGQYLAAMFPDKVKRLAIDGVFDAYSYRAMHWNTSIVDMDDCVDALFTFCHRAGPDKCSLYDSSAGKIRQRYFRVLDSVEKSPIAVPLADTPLVITRKALVSQLFYATYKPLTLFPAVVDTIRAIETANATALTALAPLIVRPTECSCNDLPDARRPWGDNDATFAIACGDGDEFTWHANWYAARYAALEAASPLMAPMVGIYALQCAEWRVRDSGRWTGPFGAAQTAHPILVVSTTHDPVTPYPDARKAHARFGGAGLLLQDSYGHCSLSSPSVCTARHVRRYFEDGALPAEGTVCEVDELPLIGKTVAGETGTMSAEDEKLLNALRGLSEGLL